ncbi:hypothetical protein ACWGH8_27875 [Nonomuraea muscovyensis]|uniref:Uncharacterized protein n=1 Tax=Nonomuraea muscovyensis TaxID=1124761 RepID=A0A7X0BWI1_9ACTN|nr:hypothetical protein [Nonomuraea muscovyensis]
MLHLTGSLAFSSARKLGKRPFSIGAYTDMTRFSVRLANLHPGSLDPAAKGRLPGYS